VAAPAALCRAGDRRSGGSAATISARRDSYQGGNLIALPSVSFGSSTVNPGSSVAISNNTPPGSRKKTQRKKQRLICSGGGSPLALSAPTIPPSPPPPAPPHA